MNNNKLPPDQGDENTDCVTKQPTPPQIGMGIGGGLVGAAIGGLLGRRVGGVSGAVVGAIAGALMGKGTTQRVNFTLDNLVDAAKSVAETINHNMNGVGTAVKDTVEEAKISVVGVVDAVKETAEEIKPSVVSVVHSVKDTVEDVTSSVEYVIHTVKETVEEIKPSVISTVKNVSEAVSNSINDGEDTLKDIDRQVNEPIINVDETTKDTDRQVNEPVTGVEEAVKDTNEEVKLSGTYNNKINQQLLLTNSQSKSDKENSLRDNIISSNDQQYEDSIPPAVFLPAPPPPPLGLAKQTTGNFFIEELKVEFQDNSKSSDEHNIQPDINQQAEQKLKGLQQPHSFQEIDIKELKNFQKIDIQDIKSNNIQEKESQESQEETTQQPRRASIQLQNEKKPKVTEMILGVSIITVIGVTLGLNPQQNPLIRQSSASYQSVSPIVETIPEIKSKTTSETITDGWMFIGNINKTLDSSLVGKPLIKSSKSTNSVIVPSVGSIVAVTVQPGVTLRDNKPQPPNFSHQEQKAIAILKPQEKLRILKVELIKLPSTTQSPIKVWAKVRRCESGCL